MDEYDGLLLTEGLHGFAWGPVEVRRIFGHEGRVCLDITTDTGKTITVYVSKTGRSVRVFGDGVEWKPGRSHNAVIDPTKSKQ